MPGRRLEAVAIRGGAEGTFRPAARGSFARIGRRGIADGPIRVSSGREGPGGPAAGSGRALDPG